MWPARIRIPRSAAARTVRGDPLPLWDSAGEFEGCCDLRKRGLEYRCVSGGRIGVVSLQGSLRVCPQWPVWLAVF
ncbi:hypothetical protein GCM10027575_78580 [Phytohabitans suffuscus]